MRQIFFILLAILILLASPINASNKKHVYIQVAVYPSIVPAIKVLEYSLQYGWYNGNTYYQFNVSEISMLEAEGRGKKPLNNENYDVFVIGASARQYFHGINKRWKDNVKQFVANGGGYVGICGGANEASLGIKNPGTYFDYIINAGALCIANVYINDDQNEEWQYLYKSAGLEGGVPIACNLTSHPIVACSPNNPRIIRYEGGPGMYNGDAHDPLLGEVIPLAFYGEEISEKAPIHIWKKIGGEWQIVDDIKTDLKGEYAAIATTYGKGKVVLFGPHPEEKTVLGGHVEEFLGRNKYTLFRQDYLYRWVNGTPLNWSYNWWMLRRSVAWAAGVDELPPVDETMLFVIKPNVWHPAIYINGRRIAPSMENVIIGKMDIQVYSNVNGKVEFCLDGKKVYEDDSPPYTWNFDLPIFGEHEIKAIVYNKNSVAYGKLNVYIVNP